MEQALANFIQTASTFQKGVFLMVAGVAFVFTVQFVFYLIVKVWPKPKQEES
jgi:Na+-transporting methylmalonyl-CoA/oxaloacetate decarboxylase gamma subunit